MTFSFLFFTITIKKRTYTGEELERLVRNQKLERYHRENTHKFFQ